MEKLMPRTADQPTDGTSVAFHCKGCHTNIGDPLYTGPAGHAPDNLCLDCWLGFWSQVEAAMESGGDWSKPCEAAWLVARGMTRQAASEAVGISRMTLYRWYRKMRAYPHLIPADIERRIEVRAKYGLAAMK